MNRMIIVLTLIFGVGVTGFNIATNSVDIIQGPDDSMFGYSLDFIQHGNTKWLLIGAPMYNGTDGNATGGVFKRNISAKAQTPTLVEILEDVSQKGRDIPTGDKRQMWLGASMATDLNTATVCAPRWTNAINDSEHYMNGLCYSLPTGFLDPSVSNFLEVTLRPLLYEYPNKQHIDPNSTEYDNVEWEYGLGAAGTSVIYNKATLANIEDSTFYGAPGVNEFTGAVLFKGGPGKAMVYGQNVTEIKESEMYGTSLAMGKFYGDGNFHLAMGGPRAMGTGQVVILNNDFTLKDRLRGSEAVNNMMRRPFKTLQPWGYSGDRVTQVTAYSSLENVMGEIIGLLEPGLTVHPDKPGSYFGASLCAVKRKSDKEEEYLLLVGAPMYSGMTTYTEYYISIQEQGAVYVYRLSTSGTDAIQMLQSPTDPGSRFGSAMTNVGDINKDGFNDVVIGAPFEGGNGVIYVYNGFLNGFLETQRIVGADLHTSLIGHFGSALSQNNTGKPDAASVAVGSYGTNMAAILYTHPSISMNVTATQTTKLTAPGAADFYIQACFQFGGGDEIPVDVRVDYRIRGDTQFSGVRKRVCFLDPFGSCVDQVVEMDQQIRKNSLDPICLTNFTVKVLETTEARELFTPVVFSVQYNISDTILCVKSICPVINRFYGYREDPMATEIDLIKVQFIKPNCGSDNICQTDVSVEVSKPNYFINPGSSILILGPKSGFKVNITLKVTGEPAYNTKLKILCNQPLSYVQTIQIKGKEMKCSVIDSSGGNSDIECDTNPSQLGLQSEEITIQMEFDARNLRSDPDSFVLMVQASTYSEDQNITNNIRNLTIQKESVVEKDFEMSVYPDIYVTKENPGQDFETMAHSIIFFNRGPSNIDGEAKVTVGFPSGRVGKRWILYTTEVVMNISNALPETSVVCNVNVSDNDNTTDTKRTYKAVNLEIMNSTKDGNPPGQYDCRKKGICNTVRCTVKPVQANSYVQLKMNFLFDPQLLTQVQKQNPDVESVDIVSVLDVELPTNIKQTVQQNDYFAKTEIVNTPKSKPLPPYVIPVTVIGGLIAIILLVALGIYLKKKGFFKSKARERLEMLIKEVETHLAEREEQENDEYVGVDEIDVIVDKRKANGVDSGKEIPNGQRLSIMGPSEKQDEEQDWDDVDGMLAGLESVSYDKIGKYYENLVDTNDEEIGNRTENGHIATSSTSTAL